LDERRREFEDGQTLVNDKLHEIEIKLNKQNKVFIESSSSAAIRKKIINVGRQNEIRKLITSNKKNVSSEVRTPTLFTAFPAD